MRKLKLALAVITLLVNVAWAQSQNPRFGKWKLKSNAPAPASLLSQWFVT